MKSFLKFIVSLFALFGAAIGALAIFDGIKNVNAEIQSFASVALAYNWNQTIGISGVEDQTFRVSSLEFDLDLNPVKLENVKHYVSAQGTQDMVLSHFTSEEYGESYMFVNFGVNNGKTNKVEAQFKDCGAVAIYGGADYSGTPEIVTLDENGKINFELEYGEGVFVVPLV